jgi:predicted RNA-binding protein YlxR (DUF448 family)
MASHPERTCIGCRAVGPASGMVRLVAPGGRVRVLVRGPVPVAGEGKLGRGAWVHPDCLGEAIERGAMARAFRRQVEGMDPATLLAQVHGVPGQSITVGKAR